MSSGSGNSTIALGRTPGFLRTFSLLVTGTAAEFAEAEANLAESRNQFNRGRDLAVTAALSRAQLEDSLYGWDSGVESNSVDVNIHKLRRKLYPEVIRTVRGLGYLMEAEA